MTQVIEYPKITRIEVNLPVMARKRHYSGLKIAPQAGDLRGGELLRMARVP